MTEFEMLEYLIHYIIVNSDSDGNVKAIDVRKQIDAMQNKMIFFGYDVPESFFD